MLPAVTPPAVLEVDGQFGSLDIDANGNYTYTRFDGAPGSSQDVFTYTLTDADGDTSTATLTINIGDAAPNLPDPALVRLDDDVIPGANGNLDGPGDDDPDAVPGNVVNGTLAGTGGDGTLTYNFTGVNTLPSGFSIGAGSDADTLLINQGTTLVMTIQLNQATGAFTVTQNAPIAHPADEGGAEDDIENNLSFSIGVEVEDADGDVEPATISINVDDDTPTVSAGGTQPTLAVDETTLGTDDSDDFSGIFTPSFGADGEAAANATVYTLGINAGSTGIVDTATNEAVVLSLNGGQVEGRTATTNLLVFVVSVDADGIVTLDQQRAVRHPDATNSDDSVSLSADNLVTLTATVTDSDGDEASATANIGQNLQFEDDGPTAAVVTTGFSISHDETPGLQGDADDVAGPLAAFASVANPGDDPHVAGAVIGYAIGDGAIGSTGSVYGADGAGTTAFSLNVSAAGVDSGLNTTEGTDILLYKEGDLIVGRAGSQAGPAAFALSIDPVSGQVSMVQYLSIQHPDATNPDESVSIATGAILAVTTVTDRDGDVSTASTGIGNLVSFQDDAPALGTVQSQQASNDPAQTPAVGTLHFTPGADGAGSTMTITANVAGMTSGGFNLVTQQSGNVLTAYQDTDGDGIKDAAETTQVFTLTVNPTAGTSGQYVFDLINPLDPTVTETLIGGSTSFGAGPTGFQILTGGTPVADLAVISGYLTQASFNASTWLSSGVLVPTAIASAGTNGSVAGWGVDNNNFENPNELFFFDFGAQATSDPDAGGPFVPPEQAPDDPDLAPEVQMPNISTATFEFISYTSGAGDAGDDIAYVVHYTDGTFDSGFVPNNAIDGDVQWKFTADAGKFIADIQFFSGLEPSGAAQDLPPGKIDLVSVGVQSSALDETIPFTVQLTDGDGDPTTTANFTVDVGLGLVPFAPAAQAPLDSKQSISDSSDTSSLSLMNTDSIDNHRTMSAANNNSVLLGAIAAAGLGVSSAAAAHGFAQASGHQVLDTSSLHQNAAAAAGFGMEHRESARDGLGGETQAIGHGNDNAGSTTVQREFVDKGSLTNDSGEQAQAPSALSQGTELQASDAGQSNLTSAAFGMPSAEMLAGGNDNAVAGQAQGTAEVGRVLLDALAGGGRGPDIDAVIDAVSNQGHGRSEAALEALASHAGLDVSAWHMAGSGGFSGGHAGAMEPMLHHDAVIVAS